MTTTAGACAPIDGRFRPESMDHFKDVAKNMAWLLERPVSQCQEELARIYRYAGLHEVQQVMKRPGTPGPFASRYGSRDDDEAQRAEENERRIFFILFGAPTGRWREHRVRRDRYFLVFEMGLFQEAAEHRACFEKIRQVVGYEVESDRWPLIHGLPLGLTSWLAANHTEPVDLAPGWDRVLPRSHYTEMHHADIRWQNRTTGQVRLDAMLRILAPRIGGRKPAGMGKVQFGELRMDDGGIIERAWEGYALEEWLAAKLADVDEAPQEQLAAIRAFAQRPSRATAAQCVFVQDLKDPVAFRDRWAFECFKADQANYQDPSKAHFSSHAGDGGVHSLFLHMDAESAEIGDDYAGEIWQFDCTWSRADDATDASRRPTLQPMIHAHGSLIAPYNDDLVMMSEHSWYLAHDASAFASEAAALAFEKIYLRAIGMRKIDFVAYNNDCAYSIIEIDELLVAPGVGIDQLKAYFTGMLDHFDQEGHLPESYGYWCRTLSVGFDDDDENMDRNQDGEYADYVCTPSVLLIDIPGCAMRFVQATHRSGKPVSTLTPHSGVTPSAEGQALAAMVMEAVRELAVDVVVYDGDA